MEYGYTIFHGGHEIRRIKYINARHSIDHVIHTMYAYDTVIWNCNKVESGVVRDVGLRGEGYMFVYSVVHGL